MAPRKKYSKEAMFDAIKAVREKRMGNKIAAKTFGVPRSTLKDKVNRV